MLVEPLVADDIVALARQGPQPGHRLLTAVATRHGVTAAELKSPSRAGAIVRARQEAMWAIWRFTPLSSTAVAQLLNRRKHTTVLRGVKAHEERLRNWVRTGGD